MTQVLERMTFKAVRVDGDTFDEARCPKCRKLLAAVSGEWQSVKTRCHRCGEVVEARRG